MKSNIKKWTKPISSIDEHFRMLFHLKNYAHFYRKEVIYRKQLIVQKKMHVGFFRDKFCIFVGGFFLLLL